jgi:hypothetical protein
MATCVTWQCKSCERSHPQPWQSRPIGIRTLLARLDVVMVSQASKGTSATFGGRRPEHDVYQLSTPYWHSAGQLYIPTVRFQLRS